MRKTSSRLAVIPCGALLAGGFILRLLIALRDVPYLTKVCLTDGSFYIFNIARNIALGRGFRHDSFTITNGFQPLLSWTRLLPWGIVSAVVVGALYLGFCRRCLGRYFRMWRVGRLNFLLVFALVLVSVYSFSIPGYWHFARYYYPVIFLSLIYSALFIEVLILNKAIS